MREEEHWNAFARTSPLVILADLDGTLIPFASRPEDARPCGDLLSLMRQLTALEGVTVAIVSGRPHDDLDAMFGDCEGLLLAAEHGGWRREAGAWEAIVQEPPGEVDALAEDLRQLAGRYSGALVERKTWSVAFHVRAIADEDRDGASVEAETAIRTWLEDHPRYEELRGAEVLEVRPSAMHKGLAVDWLRHLAGPRARMLSLGDDLTDEDAFRALGPEDESVIVDNAGARTTLARWSLDRPVDAVAFLRSVLRLRRDGTHLPSWPAPVRSTGLGDQHFRLLVVSNRLPELRSAADSFDARKRSVGGLVAALEPALRARGGTWLGWSGRTVVKPAATGFGLDEAALPALAWLDLPDAWIRRYYDGLCNGALWPLLHSFPGRMRFAREDWEAYREVNAAFAEAAGRLVGPEDTVWVHDYHLLLLGERLRDRGHEGPIGLFLHVPFPSPDMFFLLPWGEEILRALLAVDLLGFHTPGYVTNFLMCVASIEGVRVGEGLVEYRGRRIRVGAFPIGIIPDQFQSAPEASAAQDIERLMRAIAPSRLVLGVDRLDYTKGIPERISAFARLLHRHPEWRRHASLVQVSVPSRSDVPAYAEQRQRIEQAVGRTNGEYGDTDWVPVRYLYRSYGRSQLSQMYRAAAVGYVTPLRDGMNLVAKEYVAAQDPADPGVLLLSRFAGAAIELDAAVLTNPWDVDTLAEDLDRSLRMEIDERRERHARLLVSVSRTTALTWAEDFLAALADAGRQRVGTQA